MLTRSFSLSIGHPSEAIGAVQFEADEDDNFLEALRVAVKSAGIDWRANDTFGSALTFARPPEGIWLNFLLKPTDTIADVYRLLGEDASSEPPTFTVTPAGFGGGADEYFQLWEVATAVTQFALDVSGVAGLMLTGLKAKRALQYRKSRSSVKEWAFTGRLPENLVDRVKQFPSWGTREFRAEFGTDDVQTGLLLRKCGYSFLSFDEGGGLWVTRLPEDEE